MLFNFGGGSAKDQKDQKGNQPPSAPPPPEDPKRKKIEFYINVLVGGGLVLWVFSNFFPTGGSPVQWDEFKVQVANGNVEEIILEPNGHRAIIKFKNPVDGKNNRTLVIPDEARFEQKLDGFYSDISVETTQQAPIRRKQSGFMLELLKTLTPYILISVWIISRKAGKSGSGGQGGIFSVHKSKHKIAQQSNLHTRFDQVAGLDEAKQEVMEFVEFLKRPEKFQKLGAKIPKGAILVGPPGTGKTLLAKAIAGEAGVPFLSISGADFLEMFVGVGPSRVRDLFAQAKAKAPCIIWIDEIDAVGRARSSRRMGNDERENTLNQLLVEMDGFESATNVIVLAGTNRVDILDKALLRPGRFDRHISIDAPDIIGRKDIFEVHLTPLKIAEGVKTEFAKKLAALTPSMAGADIANVCNEAALIAARHDKEFIEFSDFESAIERVIAGLERKSRVLSLDERTRVAYHEAGHAIAGWFLKHASPLLKVSIIPRGIAALGYAQLQPRDQYLHSTEQLDDLICALLAGRAAEQLFFKNISTGARDDLEKVTQIIYGQLVKYGMNSKIGAISFPDNQDQLNKSYGEKTARKIDQEARTMVTNAYNRTLQLLEEKREMIEIVAQHLLKHEVLRRDEMATLIGPRPHAEVTTYEEMLGEGHKDHKEPTPPPS